MANAAYNKGLEGFATGNINFTSDDIRVMLVKSAYTFSQSHQFLSDITAGNDNGRSAALTTKTATDGVLDADDTTLTATSAVACNALVVFKHTGNDATARVLCYIDTPTSGLPFTPAASQTVNVAWDNGANKIMKI